MNIFLPKNSLPFLRWCTIALLALTGPTLQAQVKFGNSYINLTKRTVGGTVQPGDSLEIRTNIWFPNNFNNISGVYSVYYARYVDNIPTHTAFADTSLRLITNEGLVYKNWTLAASDDPGTYKATPAAGEYNVKVNLGRYATTPTSQTNDAAGAYTIITGGSSKDKPRAGSGVLITTSFRVKVTGAVGDTITLGAGEIRYKLTNNIGDPDVVVSAIQYKILISNNNPICPNAVGRNFVAEAGGTFDSGTVQNRVTPPTFLIPNYGYNSNISALSLADGNYALVNNLSPWGSTNQNAEKRPTCPSSAGPPPTFSACANRMHGGYWDIIGDHTGSTTPAGNGPTLSGNRGGYMLVVNADFATSEAYRQTINGLCPNTSYEFSLWVKNVCTVCGIDSSGTAKYNPGVYPNLSFSIDDLDRYSTGQIDTTGWMKKGFIFQTGASQSSITISIRNNASGGGGNDWAIDDIALVSCNPNMLMVPSGNSQVCMGAQLDINTTVTAYFKNYNYYRWEKSIDGGNTWTIPASGTGTPNPTTGVYVAPMTPASIIASAGDHLNQYRFTVASTPANLNDPACSFQDSARIIVMVNNCNNILSSSVVTLQGKLSANRANLKWNSEHESGNTLFDIERSDDGRSFYRIASMPGSPHAVTRSNYSFTDPGAISATAYYRIKIKEGEKTAYTKTIALGAIMRPGIHSLVNPFTDKVSFDIEAGGEMIATVTLIDNYGKLIRRIKTKVTKGLTPVVIDELNSLSKGTYILRLSVQDTIINKILVKSK